MEKVNIKPFLSGDRVYYVGKSNDLPKDKVLIVDECFVPECKCPYWTVSIKGYQSVNPLGQMLFKGDLVKCLHCHTVFHRETSLSTKFAHYFRPAQELNAPLMTFTKVAEVEKEEVLILN